MGCALVLALGLVQTSCRRGPELTSPAGPAKVGSVRLVVMVVVDQLAADTMTRLEPGLTGGLRRLLDHGVVFTGAHFRHALTLTAPGHATLSTGLDPRHSGIIENWWYSREEKARVSAVADARYGASPRRLRGTTLGDWIKAADARSKAFSASRKDRAAIMLGGHDADAAFWLDQGKFVSSSYYEHGDPRWLAEFTATHPVTRWFGKLWQPLPASLAGNLGIVRPDEGAFPRDFPHALGDATTAPTKIFYTNFDDSPFSDDYLAEFARTLVEKEQLGADDHLDFLGLSFSAVDGVGHVYGPESAETADTVLRLDRTLGALLDFLDKHVGREHLLLVFSADHGAEPLPEARWMEKKPAGRENAEDIVCAQRVFGTLQAKYGDADWFEAPDVFDRKVLAAHGVDEAAITRVAADALAQCPQYFHVWTRQELSGPEPPAGPDGTAYWRAYDPSRSPDLVEMVNPWYVDVHSRGSTHGSPWDYDTHVPLIYLLPDRQGRTVNGEEDLVDVAPTLATLLGLPRATQLDGMDRSDWVLARH